MAPIVWWTGDRSPSISERITIDEVPFNLTTPGSTVVFKMRAANSSTLKVNAPATIVDGPNGEVRYDWLSADVDTAGDFLAWWEVTTGGKVQAVGEVFIEFRAHAPDSRVLCTRPDVIRLVPGYRDDPVTDGIIDDLIQAESQTWFRETGREIVPISSGSSARLFDVGLAEERSRQVWIGDAATVTTVKLQDQTGATLETVASGDYVPIQRTRQPWEPIRGLWFPTGSLAPATVAAGRVLEVTGTWGFPSVPNDIRLAVARMTLVRYLADATPAGSALSDALNEQGFDVAMAFASAQSTKHSYGIPLVA
jgi:hypothetical protein